MLAFSPTKLVKNTDMHVRNVLPVQLEFYNVDISVLDVRSLQPSRPSSYPFAPTKFVLEHHTHLATIHAQRAAVPKYFSKTVGYERVETITGSCSAEEAEIRGTPPPYPSMGMRQYYIYKKGWNIPGIEEAKKHRSLQLFT